MIKQTIAAAICFFLISCNLGPRISVPAPSFQRGLHVSIERIEIGPYSGKIVGTVTNVGSDLSSCFLTFDVLESGVKVEDAMDSIHGLRSGHKWRFSAPFAVQRDFFGPRGRISAVRLNEVQVFR